LKETEKTKVREQVVDKTSTCLGSHGGDRGWRYLGIAKDYRPLKKSSSFSPKTFPRIFPSPLGRDLSDPRFVLHRLTLWDNLLVNAYVSYFMRINPLKVPLRN
jgi:hypothetical protein